MCFGADFGAEIDLNVILERSDRISNQPDIALFNETAGTFLAEVENEKVAKKLFTNVQHTILGQTTQKNSIIINHGQRTICTASVEKLKQSWQKPMKEIFH